MLIPCEVEVTDKRISYILCNAFEGGSNYWIDHVKFYLNNDHVSAGQARSLLKDKTCFDSSMTSKDMEDPAYLWLPLVKDGELKIVVNEAPTKTSGTVFFLDRARIESGLKFMAANYRKHFNDLIDENDDAITGDVFLQCCIFNELIFG